MALTKAHSRMIAGAFSNVKDFGAVGDGVADDTTAIQAAHDVGISVYYPSGTYLLSDRISLSSSASVFLSSDVTVKQGADNKAIFYALSKSNIFIDGGGATLQGYGNYSNTWTGNSGHEDRALNFTSCTNISVSNFRIIDASNSGLYIEHTTSFRGSNFRIEGTHTHGAAIVTNDNFQNGIYIKHKAATGDCTDIQISDFDISGTAQGILIETYTGYVGSEQDIRLSGVIHDIPGQHGLYLQSGNIIANINASDCALNGAKIQVGGTRLIENFDITLIATSCGDAGLSVQNAGTVGTARINNVTANVVSNDCQRGLSINNDLVGGKFKVISRDSTQHGLIVQGTGNSDLDIDILSINSGRNGVYVTSSDLTNCTIRPKVRQANTSTGSYYGIHIENCSDCILIDPEATDTGTKQVYGLFVAAGDVYVRGSAVFTGASSYSARANVLLKDWPSYVDVGGTTTTKLLNRENFGYTEAGRNIGTAQTTSASDVVLWELALADESLVTVHGVISAKLSGSGDQYSAVSAVSAYRNGGGAALNGSATSIASIASAGNSAAFSWAVSGNNIRLLCNSGAAETNDWKSAVEVVRVE
jgi:hypothetical protein